jgi:iron complex transport system permease protein
LSNELKGKENFDMNSPLKNTALKLSGILILLIVMILLIYLSIVYGVINTNWRHAIEAYTQFNGTNEHIAIRDVRVPRALVAAVVGANLGVAGALLQALTKNPVADTGILGINSGASLFIVFSLTFFSVNSIVGFTWIAFLGAALSGLAMYGLGSLGRGGMTPIKLTLAGAALSALASSYTHGMLVVNEKVLDEVLFWLSGSVAGRSLDMLISVMPFVLVGWISSLMIAGQVNTLLLGEDVARGLGQRTALVKLGTGITIILLAGSSVGVAGPIGFIGLITPHLARYLVGIDTRWVILYSAFLGSIFLLGADIAARFIAMPRELPIGVVTALVGAPFFITVARKGELRV